MRKIVIDMQNYLFADAVATAFKSSDYYMDGYTVKDIPELAHISASTVKTHNRNLYRKMGVDSFDELKVYIELFASCGRSGELLKR